MTISGLLFLGGNLGIVAGYMYAAGLILMRKGPARTMGRIAWLAGLAFFVLCGATHAEMAIHTMVRVPLLHDPQHPEWHMVLIHVPQALSIWVFLWAMNIHTRNGGPPLEGQATTTNEYEPHP